MVCPELGEPAPWSGKSLAQEAQPREAVPGARELRSETETEAYGFANEIPAKMSPQDEQLKSILNHDIT